MRRGRRRIGREALARKAAQLLDGAPPEFAFVADGPAYVGRIVELRTLIVDPAEG